MCWCAGRTGTGSVPARYYEGRMTVRITGDAARFMHDFRVESGCGYQTRVTGVTSIGLAREGMGLKRESAAGH